MEELNNASISAAVTARIVAKRLSTEELVCFCTAAAFGDDPRGMEGYEKVKILFIRESGGKEMHGDMLAALQDIAQERLDDVLHKRA